MTTDTYAAICAHLGEPEDRHTRDLLRLIAWELDHPDEAAAMWAGGGGTRMTDPEHYHWERMWERRCPRCGSPNGSQNDYILLDDGDEQWCGWFCDDCGYDAGCDGHVYKDAPFITPGDAGSHDQVSDYDAA